MIRFNSHTTRIPSTPAPFPSWSGQQEGEHREKLYSTYRPGYRSGVCNAAAGARRARWWHRRNWRLQQSRAQPIRHCRWQQQHLHYTHAWKPLRRCKYQHEPKCDCDAWLFDQSYAEQHERSGNRREWNERNCDRPLVQFRKALFAWARRDRSDCGVPFFAFVSQEKQCGAICGFPRFPARELARQPMKHILIGTKSKSVRR